MKCSTCRDGCKEHACDVKNNMWTEPQGQGCTYAPERASDLEGLVQTARVSGSGFSLTSLAGLQVPQEDMKRHHSQRLRWNLLFYSQTRPPPLLELMDTQSFLVPLMRGLGRKGRSFFCSLSAQESTAIFFFLMLFTFLRSPGCSATNKWLLLRQF